MASFYDVLKCTGKKYTWSCVDGKICGRSLDGELVNPIVAVVREAMPSGPKYSNSSRDTWRAASRLNLPDSFVYACLGIRSTNRGNAQVVRGRIKSALKINSNSLSK